MFSPEERARVRERVVALARKDPRVTGGANTGSAATGAEDIWSDIDLSFGVADDVELLDVLADWTEALGHELDLVHHWDLRSGSTIYRVFLLPGGLELDVAVTPASEFGARGPKFRLLFGRSVEVAPAAPPDVDELIGLGWLSVLDARSAIERGRPWAAEYWISAARDQSIALACLRLGEPTAYARGIDRLPKEVVDPYERALVSSLEPDELRRALAVARNRFIDEVAILNPELAQRLRAPLADTSNG
jgi:predicted nucleotidyltransferase